MQPAGISSKLAKKETYLRVLLESQFLEVGKNGFLSQQFPFFGIGTIVVITLQRLSIFELLDNIFIFGLTELALETSQNQFWPDFGGSGDGSRNGGEFSHIERLHIPNLLHRVEVSNSHVVSVVFLLQLGEKLEHKDLHYFVH